MGFIIWSIFSLCILLTHTADPNLKQSNAKYFPYSKLGVFEDQDHLYIGGYRNSKEPRWVSNEDMNYWYTDGQADLEAQLRKQPEVRQAKNIIYFLADGTSMSTFTSTRLLKGTRSGVYEREKNAWEDFPFTGIIKTYNTDNIVTDSAASSTAYLSGVKANQGTIGVDVNVHRGNCDEMLIEGYHTSSILRDFQLANRSTGVVTTTRITHASPAGNYAHTAERLWENDNDMNDDNADSELCDDIAEQLVLRDTGSKIKVALGGGRRNFLPKEIVDEDGKDGKREDGQNLIQIWQAYHQATSNAVYVGHRDDLLSVDVASTDYLLGLFNSTHMSYVVDEADGGTEPSLSEMTEKAIQILQKDPNGFYLFVEGGNIDRAHHLNEATAAIEEGLEFEKAVAKAVSMTSSEETLIIVTADHGQAMLINGYPARHDSILGLAGPSDVDDMLYNVLMYTNGPGFRDQKNDLRPDSEKEDYADPNFVAPSTVPLVESAHNGEDVVIFASGPHSHLFTGVHENSYIPQALRYAACVGQGLQFCDTKTKL